MADYYFDATDGNDANNGTSEVTAWKTTVKFNSEMLAGTFAPAGVGKTIAFQRGETWRVSEAGEDPLRITDSGASGTPIVVTAYGSGTRPRILGSSKAGPTWTDEGSSKWSATWTAQGLQPGGNIGWLERSDGEVEEAGYVVDTASLVSNYQWTRVAGTPDKIWIYWDGGTPTFTFEGPLAASGQSRDYCIGVYETSQSYVTIENFICRYGRDDGIILRPPTSGTISNIIVQDCEAGAYINASGRWDAGGGGQGFITHQSNTGSSVTNITVRRCRFYFAENHGMQWINNNGTGTQSNIIYEACEVFDCGHNLVDFNNQAGALSNVTVRYCRLYVRDNFPRFGTLSSSGVAGIYLQPILAGLDMTGVELLYNLIYDTHGNGISVAPWTDAAHTLTGKMIGNTIYGANRRNLGWLYNVRFSNNASGTYDNWELKNNINAFPRNGVACISFDNGLRGSTLDYNCYAVTSGIFAWQAGNSYSTIAAWRTATVQEANSLLQDPLFVNTSDKNFSLQATSPSLNTGVDLGDTYDSGLDPVSTWPSGVQFKSQDAAGSGWEMGAYVYPTASPTDRIFIAVGG